MADFYQIPLDMSKSDPEYLRWEKLNFILRQIFTVIGNIDGNLGPIENKNSMDMGGNQITSGPDQILIKSSDYVTKSYFRSAEFGGMVVQLLSATGKTPLSIAGAIGTPISGGGSGGVTDHALLTNLSYALSAHVGFVPAVRTITTSAPLTGGGDLSANRTFAIPQAGILLDGYLSSVDWNAFNAKANALSGTSGVIAKFTSASTIGDSIIKEAAGKIGIGTTGVPAYKLEVEGQIKASLGSILPAVKVISIVAGILATDASLANHFRCTVDAAFTLSNPSNAVDGQRILWEFVQDATGNRVITLGNNFSIPINLPDVILSLGAGKTDMLGVVYNSLLGKFIVTGFAKEYT